MLLKIFSPAALLYRLFIEANFSVTSNSTLIPQEDNWAVLVIFVNLARVQENHSKPHALLINTDIEPKVLNFSSNFLSHKLTVWTILFSLNTFLQLQQSNIISMPHQYMSFLAWLTNKPLGNLHWMHLIFVFLFLGRNCCNEILSFKFTHFFTVAFLWVGCIVMSA